MNTLVFRYGANFERVRSKSKINGIIGSEMAVSFCKDDTQCARCFNITGRFVAKLVEVAAINAAASSKEGIAKNEP